MLEACITWALAVLENLGYQMQNQEPEIILKTAWSSVFRFSTQLGFCYLKQVPPALSLEMNVIQILQTHSSSVPILIASNPKEHCFLMQDAGIPLREFFKQQFNVNILKIAIQDYIYLQHAMIDHLPLFLNIGVPDWRLNKIPSLYQELITQEKLLLEDGLTAAELKQLFLTQQKLIDLCQQISHYPIPETLSHCDFHDNNLLIQPKKQKITVVDLGEVAITHPFFSLLNVLHRTKETYQLTESQYGSLQQHALKPWLKFASQEQLLQVMSLIKQCWSIHHVLAEYRLIQSIDQVFSEKLRREGRLANNLRFWLKST